MDFIRFFLPKNSDFGPFVRSANALASRIQGSVADGITGLETRVEDLEDEAPAIGTPISLSGQTSGDFTGIPSWATYIVVSLIAGSTNGVSVVRLRAGTGGVAATTGYSGSSETTSGATTGTFTAGFDGQRTSATAVRHGVFELTKQNASTRVWTCRFALGGADAGTGESGAGSVTLSGALDMVRITTANGTDLYDASAEANIWYA